MPSLSDFVSGAVPTAEAIQVAPAPAVGLDGGTLTQTLTELQTEINTNAGAADLAVVLFENSLL